MENVIINAINTLKPEIFASFINEVQDGETIIAFWTDSNGQDCSKEFDKSTIVDNFFHTSFDSQFTKTQVITLACNACFIQMSGWDVEWWDEKYKVRHSRMKNSISFYGAKEEKKKAKNESTFYRHIACATLKDDKLVDIEHCEITTSVKDILNTLNSWLDKYFIASSSNTIRFNLSYTEGDEKDLSKWKSVDDLVKEGTCVLA